MFTRNVVQLPCGNGLQTLLKWEEITWDLGLALEVEVKKSRLSQVKEGLNSYDPLNSVVNSSQHMAIRRDKDNYCQLILVVA